MHFLILILLFVSSARALAVTNDEGSVTYSDETVTHGDTYYEDFEDPTESVVEEEDYYIVLSDEPTSGKIPPFLLLAQ